MEAPTQTIVTPDRRRRYRPLLERLNPIARPRDLLAQDLIVTRTHDPSDATQPALHVSLATSAELTRGIQIAVVGGIGSGKTTELALTHRLLKRHADAVNLFIDIANMADMNELSTGAILASVGIRLSYHREKQGLEAPKEIRSAFAELRNLAFGTTKWVEANSLDYPDEDYDAVPVRMPGLLRLRFPALKREVEQVKALVEQVASPFTAADAQITILVDGLDRLMKPELFREFAEQDLQALKRLKISVIIAAPLLLWYDESRFLDDRFDVVKHIPAAAPNDSAFLMEILERRGASDLMDRTVMASMAKYSGGVLRDLLTLARSAAEYAYQDDQDRISRRHGQLAIRQLGNRYLTGLGKLHHLRLRQLMKDEGFRTEDTVSRELLVNRQVLEHFRRGREVFVVHPALKKMLPRVA